MQETGGSLSVGRDEVFTRIDQMHGRIEGMQQWTREHLRKTLDQFDKRLARPDLSAEDFERLMNQKTRALQLLNEANNRFELTLHREGRLRFEKMKVQLRGRIRAQNLVDEHKRRLRTTGDDYDVTHGAMPQPKVKMFVPGCDFRATVAIDRVNRLPPEAMPEPP